MKKGLLLLVLFVFVLNIQVSVCTDVSKWLQTVNMKLEALESTDELFWYDWNTDINEENEALAIEADKLLSIFKNEAITNITKFSDDEINALSDAEKRELYLLRVLNDIPPLKDEDDNEQLSKLIADMSGIYSTNTIALPGGGTGYLTDAEDFMANSFNYTQLGLVWYEWRYGVRSMKSKYEQMVELSNKGAQQIEFNDTGDLWKSRFDMSAKDFEKLVDKLWNDLKPLYSSLHCYVRSRLNTFYNEQNSQIVFDGIDQDGNEVFQEPIPAHILGNMWAQDWSNIYDIVVPFPEASTPDISPQLQDKTPVNMVQYAENFFSSLGLGDLPHKFWDHSMLSKPEDKDVVCHASAWDIDRGNEESDEDVRLKMCIEKTQSDLITIHHELGHIYYYKQYRTQPQLFRNGANNGFHEGIGDTIALSTTPDYFQKIDLLPDFVSDEKSDMNQLMMKGLEKIAFLPFGLLIDKWRWDVFSGKTKPEDYTNDWWYYRNYYQGVQTPFVLSEEDFHPGAKFHVPSDVPYIRYFLAAIYQFQFHEALCKLAGHEGPLYKCSIYESEEAGAKLKEMLSLGASKPWQEALGVILDQEDADISASSLLKYFKPLHDWLNDQIDSQDLQCGWKYKSRDGSYHLTGVNNKDPDSFSEESSDDTTDPKKEDESNNSLFAIILGLACIGCLGCSIICGLVVVSIVKYFTKSDDDEDKPKKTKKKKKKLNVADRVQLVDAV
eukprot:TRINITY_DN9498_c0_g1_i1.p1 TRINITY_DN9498_c0_g1~~TRINITY_DN9498_c0_g1_i1.p1  ORF type:complete len:723 (-),score=260.59 TRINITY_DN9498_c0_g1_i1:106-2274(-)